MGDQDVRFLNITFGVERVCVKCRDIQAITCNRTGIITIFCGDYEITIHEQPCASGRADCQCYEAIIDSWMSRCNNKYS